MHRFRDLVLLFLAVSWLAGCGGKVASGSATGVDVTLPPSVPVSALGGACLADLDCDPAAFCSLEGSACGTCASRLPDGATCQLDRYYASQPSQPCGQHALCIGDLSHYPQTGICTPITYVGEGAACVVTSSPSYGGDGPDLTPPNVVQCADPLRCIAGTCGLPHARPIGGACDGDDDCADGLYCPWSSSSSSPAQSVCMPKRLVSATCDRDEACLSGLCCSYGPCAGEPFLCIEPAGLGEPCFGGDWCKPGLSCDDTSGACVMQPALGDPCDPTAGDVVCVAGTECDESTSTCAASPTPHWGALGEPCSEDDQARQSCADGLACDAGRCKSATEYCAR